MNELTPQEKERREQALRLARFDTALSRGILLVIVLVMLAVLLIPVFRDEGSSSPYVSDQEPACQVSYCP